MNNLEASIFDTNDFMKKYFLLFLLGLVLMTACRTVKPNLDFAPLVEMTAEKQEVLFYLKLDETVTVDWGDGNIENVIPQKDSDTRIACSHIYSDYHSHVIVIRGSSKALLYISSDRNLLTDFKSYRNSNLSYLSVSYNRLQILNVPPNTVVTNLGCAYNDIKELDMTQYPSVVYLSCEQNPLSMLDVSKNADLKYLAFCHTEIAKIDISNNIKLEKIVFHASRISELDVRNNSNLKDIRSYATPLAKNEEGIKTLAEKLPSRVGMEKGKWFLYNDEEEENVREKCSSKNWELSRL